MAVVLVATDSMAAERTMMTLGTATPGGSFETLAAAINEADGWLDVRTQHTRGSTENVPTTAARTAAPATRVDLIHSGVRRYFRDRGRVR